MNDRPGSQKTAGSTVGSAAEASLGRIAARDDDVRAWVHFDPEAARAEARRIDMLDGPLPLKGLTLGVKDIIDVAAMPTGCGSPIHAGRIAAVDAALVAELRALGALIMGKSVSTEFAHMTPGPTRNPRNLAFSPAGSSSGPAASVADGHVDAALGTQTAGSIIRPAAFCGVVGYKPTHGLLSLAGIKSLAPTFDTVGWIAKDVATSARLRAALSGVVPPAEAFGGPRFALIRGPFWASAESAARETVEYVAKAVSAATCEGNIAPIEAVHATIMRFEMRRELATERLQFPDLLSAQLRAFLGQAVPEADYVAAIDELAAFDVEALFGEADILVALAAPGEAVPFGTTGDPVCNRIWTALGTPCITVPCGTGPNGLPLGVQLIARRHDDDRLHAAAAVIEALAG